MPVFQHPIQPRSFVVPASLNRLLLACRFDFRQKSWGLPAAENRRDLESILLANSAALALAVSKNFSKFSDPAQGGRHSSKTVFRRTGLRVVRHRSLENINKKSGKYQTAPPTAAVAASLK
jgi:hypothetical protein